MVRRYLDLLINQARLIWKMRKEISTTTLYSFFSYILLWRFCSTPSLFSPLNIYCLIYFAVYIQRHRMAIKAFGFNGI
jgi:hypothetical protein